MSTIHLKTGRLVLQCLNLIITSDNDRWSYFHVYLTAFCYMEIIIIQGVSQNLISFEILI